MQILAASGNIRKISAASGGISNIFSYSGSGRAVGGSAGGVSYCAVIITSGIAAGIGIFHSSRAISNVYTVSGIVYRSDIADGDGRRISIPLNLNTVPGGVNKAISNFCGACAD